MSVLKNRWLITKRVRGSFWSDSTDRWTIQCLLLMANAIRPPAPPWCSPLVCQGLPSLCFPHSPFLLNQSFLFLTRLQSTAIHFATLWWSVKNQNQRSISTERENDLSRVFSLQFLLQSCFPLKLPLSIGLQSHLKEANSQSFSPFHICHQDSTMFFLPRKFKIWKSCNRGRSVCQPKTEQVIIQCLSSRTSLVSPVMHFPSIGCWSHLSEGPPIWNKDLSLLPRDDDSLLLRSKNKRQK